jgi:hypothetical protein
MGQAVKDSQESKNMAARPILVTGSIRSGTTWAGRMISKSPSVGYIHEPLNPWEKPEWSGICNVRVPHWFLYITKENESAYYKSLKDSLHFRYSLLGGLKGIKTFGDIKRVMREYKTFRQYRSQDLRPLIKDPFALFSAGWFAETFNMDVVILIRHPAAVVSSLKRLRWGLPLHHLLRQSLLMRDYLHPFESQLIQIQDGQKDLIDRAILLWNVIYYAVSKHRDVHKDWIFIRHEDVSRDAIGCFQDIFARLRLDFSPKIESAIEAHSKSSNPREFPVKRAHFMKRNSRAAIWNWKDRLTNSEIERVREGTWDIAKEFYSEDEW